MSLPTSVVDSALHICEGAATPRALTVAILIRYQEWDQLVSLRCDPRRYERAEDYFADLVPTELLRKYRGFKLSVDLHEEAVKSFFESESQCFRTNERLNPYLEGFTHPLCDERVARIIRTAREKVRLILGRPDKLIPGRFGPGATFADRGQRTTVAHKMMSNPTMTSRAWPFLFDWAGTAWAKALAARDGGILTTVRGNRFTSVPKDSTKNRGICIEPSLNIYYQLGIGDMMKKRLRNFGIELAVQKGPSLPDRMSDVIGLATGPDGQERHRRKAKEASLDGSHATVDLSSASDTVCYNLVKLLLPSEWFELLDDLRSPYTFMPCGQGGNWVKLEKFSSMGNGYTFELETVIFLALILALISEKGKDVRVGRDLMVYGDDIIVPGEFAEESLAMLRFFGFTPNERKTFVSGHFRESCGGDFFSGANVRPYYLESEPNEPNDLIAYANGIRRLRHRGFNTPRLERGLFLAWSSVLHAIPSHIRRCRGPEVLGDIVIHDEPRTWSRRYHADTQTPWIQVYRPARFRRVSWDHIPADVTMACALLRYGSGLDGITPRDAVLGHKIGWVSVE